MPLMHCRDVVQDVYPAQPRKVRLLNAKGLSHGQQSERGAAVMYAPHLTHKGMTSGPISYTSMELVRPGPNT